MQRTMKLVLVAGAITAAAAGIGTAAVGAASSDGASNDEHDTPITGTALDQASRAALAQTGGGRVTGTEINDEESYYEVEVTLADGRQVDVQLDRRFQFVSAKTDHESGTGNNSGS